MKRALPRSLGAVLASDERLAAWSARHANEQDLLRRVRRMLPPPVAERIVVSDDGSGRLEVSTSAGAIAALVRQKGPELLRELRRQGRGFSELRVRVAPRGASAGAQRPVPRAWDHDATRPLSRLASTLPDGPLRNAIAQLLRNRR